MFKRHLATALMFGMAAAAPPASAQHLPCGDREDLAVRLENRFKEKQAGLGLQSADRLVEIWTSQETGSWTILITLSDGTACVMATGANWHGGPELTVPVKKGQPS